MSTSIWDTQSDIGLGTQLSSAQLCATLTRLTRIPKEDKEGIFGVNCVTIAQSTTANRTDMPHAYGSDAYHSMNDEGLIGEEEIHDEER